MKSPFINQEPTSFERYTRQLDLPEIGLSGQRKLAGSSVCVVGAGGLGSPLLTALAGAGVGRIGICESDHVEGSNLNRQFFYSPGQIGQSKIALALAFLRQYQPETEWIGYKKRLTAEDASKMVRSYDLVLAAVDNRKTRCLLNQAACEAGRSFIDAGIKGWDGYVLFVNPGLTACYVCFCGGCAPEESASGIKTDKAEKTGQKTKAESQKPEKPSVIGATAGLIGSLQAQIALRWLLLGDGAMPKDLLLYNGEAAQISKVKLKRMPGCPICGSL